MNRMINDLVHVSREIWKNIGIPQRVSLVLIGIAALAAIGAILVVSGRPDWAVLYANMERDTASRIYDLVNDNDIPVQLRDAGRTIMVPSAEVNRIRLMVARDGITVERSGDGWELFDDLKLGMTSKQQQVNFQRAVQGELERMIAEIPGVARAQIMLAVPGRKAFRRGKSEKPSASVLITVEPGYRMQGGQVASIRHLVASGVNGLDPNDVTVSDSRGNLLARPISEEDAWADSDSQLEVQKRIERELQNKAEAILSPIVGADGVVATVTVQLDFAEIDTVSEQFDPSKTVVVNETIQTEENQTRDESEQRPAGASSNVVAVNDPESTASADSQASTSTRKTVQNSYIVPKTSQSTKVTGPRIRGLSAAVMVTRTADGGERSPEELESFRRLVMSAIGGISNGPDGRSDVVEILEQQFVAQPEPSIGVGETLMGQLSMLQNAASVQAIMALVLLFVLYRIFRRTFNEGPNDQHALEPAMAYGGDNVVEVGKGGGSDNALTSGDESNSFDFVTNRSVESPEAVAKVVQSLLMKEQDW